MRFLVVATLALLANLAVLELLVSLGAGKIVGQACAIVLVTPLNFVGNKLWSFRVAPVIDARRPPDAAPADASRR